MVQIVEPLHELIDLPAGKQRPAQPGITGYFIDFDAAGVVTQVNRQAETGQGEFMQGQGNGRHALMQAHIHIAVLRKLGGFR